MKHNEPYEKILSQTASIDDILIQIVQNLGIADHKFTKEEIEEARGNLSPMNDTMRREKGLNEIQVYIKKRESVGMEKMIVMALQNNVPSEAVEVMRQGAGITDIRFSELKKQAHMD